MKKISAAATRILREAEISGNKATLTCGQLAPSLYKEVDTVLKRLGGKWTKKSGSHEFPYPAASLLEDVLATGVLPAANPHDFFPTPSDLVEEILASPYIDGMLADRGDDIRILEPSIGRGAFLSALIGLGIGADLVDAYEIDPLNAAFARDLGPVNLKVQDFMTVIPQPVYDLILMNPPFAGTTYAKHINHARRFLKPGGILAFIAPTSLLNGGSKDVEELIAYCADCGAEAFEHPEGSFAESGTNVKTLTSIVVNRSERPREIEGFRSYEAYQIALSIDNNASALARRDQILTSNPDLTPGLLAPKLAPLFLDVVKSCRVDCCQFIRLTDDAIVDVAEHCLSSFRNLSEWAKVEVAASEPVVTVRAQPESSESTPAQLDFAFAA